MATGRRPVQHRVAVDHKQTDPWTVVRELGAAQGGVVSRRQLYAAGLTRWQLRAQLKARRWQRIADQSICLHNGPVEQLGLWWAAVFQGGPRACLDGASALVAGGLERYTVDRIRVSVPRGAKVRRTPAHDIRQTRRWEAADLAPAGVPRTRPDVAAIRGALWARTDRQATYLLTLTVQQGLAPATGRVATGRRDRWHPPHLGRERRRRRSATELAGHRRRHRPPTATP